MNEKSQQKPSFTNQKALLEGLSAQAPEYAEHQFGTDHPIWRSIHDQVACFCKDAHDCARHKQSGNRPQRQTH